MLRKTVAALALSCAAILPAHAQLVLLAQGQLTGSKAGAGKDLSGLNYTLENGLPANILGGLGSGLTYAGGNVFLAVPDRGPNATPYNSAVDDTASYISRFQTLTMTLTANPSAGLPFTLTPELQRTTLLYSPTALQYGTGAGLGTKADGTPIGSGAPVVNTAGHYYFSGRSDNYGAGASSNPLDARFDPEAVRVSNDGKSVFISDEYGPYVRQFDRATGALVKTFTLPGNLAVTTLSPNGQTEIDKNATGRVANKGMEGLAITPDGKTLVGILQAALEQDAGTASKLLRIVTIDIATGATHEYGYKLTNGSGVSEIVAVNNHQFLVDERDGKGLGDGTAAKVKQLFLIDLDGATDITNLTGKAAQDKAIAKSSTPFLDLVAELGKAGIAATNVPAKIEGVSFGQDVTYNGATYHTLYLANDNDFVPATSGQNQFYVFGFQDKDLKGYVAQSVAAAPIPEPGIWAMLVAGVGAIGSMLRRRRPATARS
ncbi:esterase-like activity of phytase family protein [uncultured Sphingomonas sp.]|uniref:esterase-like activity of phytase family protein n=1 Tax=uncultured Sphingomonas sp. TaxID=158754 RepID=UPI0025ECBF3F|nr:esterase-like activity of phytase family protein [uncultured Sphingomonas sp.]